MPGNRVNVRLKVKPKPSPYVPPSPAYVASTPAWTPAPTRRINTVNLLMFGVAFALVAGFIWVTAGWKIISDNSSGPQANPNDAQIGNVHGQIAALVPNSCIPTMTSSCSANPGLANNGRIESWMYTPTDNQLVLVGAISQSNQSNNIDKCPLDITVKEIPSTSTYTLYMTSGPWPYQLDGGINYTFLVHFACSYTGQYTFYLGIANKS